MLGRKRSRVIGTPFASYVAGKAKQQFCAHVRQVFQSRDRRLCELKLKTDGGERRYVRLESVCAKPVRGIPEACRSAVVHVSQRREAEDALTARMRQQAAVAELGQSALAGVDLGELRDVRGGRGPAGGICQGPGAP